MLGIKVKIFKFGFNINVFEIFYNNSEKINFMRNYFIVLIFIIE